MLRGNKDVAEWVHRNCSSKCHAAFHDEMKILHRQGSSDLCFQTPRGMSPSQQKMPAGPPCTVCHPAVNPGVSGNYISADGIRGWVGDERRERNGGPVETRAGLRDEM